MGSLDEMWTTEVQERKTTYKRIHLVIKTVSISLGALNMEDFLEPKQNIKYYIFFSCSEIIRTLNHRFRHKYDSTTSIKL